MTTELSMVNHTLQTVLGLRVWAKGVPSLQSSQKSSIEVFLGVRERDCECRVLENMASVAARAIMLDLETIRFAM